ncbi:MAG: hypothetical protein ACREF9_00505 [Opitutaceae bacterium]
MALAAGRAILHGRLHVPTEANGLVLFARGGESSRNGPRNQRVAESLHDVAALAARWFNEHLRKDANVVA